MELLTTKQAAEILGVTVKTIKRWRKSGQLIPVQTGDNGYSAYSHEQLKNFKPGTQTRDTGKTGDTKNFNVPSLINADVPTFETVSAKPRTHGLHGGKNTMKQLENLPIELLAQPRFFPVTQNKIPKIANWQQPENQKRYNEIEGVLAGFDTSGHDVGADYALLDFDHVLDDEGNFVNAGAEELFADVINALDTNAYCERSISGHGLHILVKPTPGKFGKLSAGRAATLYFDNRRGKDSPKLEIFYLTGGRYCLLTGDRFKCGEGAVIPNGVDVDIVLQYLLQQIHDKLPKNPVPEKKNSAPIFDNAEKPSEMERARWMLAKIPCAEQTYSDWVAAGMILKNNGNSLSDWENWSATDPARFKPGECKKKWEGFSDNGGLTIATLHRFARVLYGYSEKDSQREWYSAHSPKKFQDNRADGRAREENSAPEVDNMTEEEIIADIRAKLERGGKDGNGQIKKSTRNIDYILSHDPRLKNLVGYDEFSGQDVFLKKPIWRKDNCCVGKEWTDRDDAELRRYIALEYDDLYHEKRIFDCLTHYSMKNSFNAVKKFLSDIPAWDGTPRAETLFIDFLKVADSSYAREVTLNFLLGALARIYYPGCEFQTALVLRGRQGIGKSYLLHELGGKWHVSLNDEIGTAHAIDAIQPGWLVEIEEFRAGRRAEVNALKSFISARDDTRRAAYERRAKKTARHCVFCVTCNDEQILKDRTGNRRFIILQCGNETNEIVKELTAEYVQQVWAEALFKFNELFKGGFDERKLRLTPETMIKAEEIAGEHLQDDGLDAEVAAFVERKIPAAPVWNLLTAPERRKFFEQAHIEISAEELRNRAKVNPRKHDIEKLNAVLDETETHTANGLLIYGTEYRRHICAAELNLECFSQTDRRKNMIRLNEVLTHLSGWQKGKPIYRDTCYGDLRNVYYRAEQPEEIDGEIAPVEVPF